MSHSQHQDTSVFGAFSSKALGDRISEFRKRRGLTQEEAASRLGVTPWTLGQWENGHVSGGPSTRELCALAALLGVSVQDLCGAPEEKVPHQGKTAYYIDRRVTALVAAATDIDQLRDLFYAGLVIGVRVGPEHEQAPLSELKKVRDHIDELIQHKFGGLPANWASKPRKRGLLRWLVTLGKK